MIHPEMANVPKAQIKAKLAHMLKAKEENVAIFGLKTKFGGGRSTGFATIYDSVDLRKKYDSKKMLRRVITHSFFSLCFLILYIGRLSCQRKVRKKAKKGNQGQSKEGQRYRQGQGCSIRWQEEVRMQGARSSHCVIAALNSAKLYSHRYIPHISSISFSF